MLPKLTMTHGPRKIKGCKCRTQDPRVFKQPCPKTVVLSPSTLSLEEVTAITPKWVYNALQTVGLKLMMVVNQQSYQISSICVSGKVWTFEHLAGL